MSLFRSRARPFLGKIRNPHCEINVADHCNLNCRSCSHLSPVMARNFADPAVLYRDLHTLSFSYRARRLFLLGGEPLLHPDLAAVVDAARKAGIAPRLRLVTNGMLLPRMSAACWAAIDEVHVSSYPGHELSEAEREHCRARAREGRTELRWNPIRRFRESHSGAGTTDAALVSEIYSTCRIAHFFRCHLVADGYLFKCPQSYSLALLSKCEGGIAGNGIEIGRGPEFVARLTAYLNASDPLPACSYCLGTVGRTFGYEETRRQEWDAPQQRPAEKLIDPLLLDGAQRHV